MSQSTRKTIIQSSSRESNHLSKIIANQFHTLGECNVYYVEDHLHRKNVAGILVALGFYCYTYQTGVVAVADNDTDAFAACLSAGSVTNNHGSQTHAYGS